MLSTMGLYNDSRPQCPLDKHVKCRDPKQLSRNNKTDHLSLGQGHPQVAHAETTNKDHYRCNKDRGSYN